MFTGAAGAFDSRLSLPPFPAFAGASLDLLASLVAVLSPLTGLSCAAFGAESVFAADDSDPVSGLFSALA